MNFHELQSIVRKFTEEKRLNSPLGARIMDLISEVGELSKEYLKATKYEKEEFEKSEEWDSEIGDVLFSLICIANETDANLEDCLKYVLDKYEKRFNSKGDIGSGR